MACARRIVLVVLLSWTAATVALAGCEDALTCALPPAGANPTGAVVGGTYDDGYIGLLTQGLVNHLWSGLDCDKCDWDGWNEGYSQPANLQYPLARLFTGAYLVYQLQLSARHSGFGLWRPVYSGGGAFPESDVGRYGHWWDFVGGYGQDEWVPGCATGKNGEHRQTTLDEFNILHRGGAYFSAAVTRASTLVHETTHQSVSHVDAGDCSPSNASCDSRYRRYNANTMQVDFLHDALVAYRYEKVAGQAVRLVARTGDTCRWIPTFSQEERNQITSRADGVMMRFAKSAWPGWKQSIKNEVAARQAEATWSCPACDLGDWTFYPTCYPSVSNKACAEPVHPDNVWINAHNRAACAAYNAAVVVPGASAKTVAQAKQAQLMQTLPCKPPSAAAARQFCDAEKASASHVADVDDCGWLNAAYSLGVSRFDCMQEWCAEQFAADPWTPEHETNGCTKKLCNQVGPCGNSNGTEECRETFYMAHGDPKLYIAACEHDACKALMARCLLALHQDGAWSYGEPLPETCLEQKSTCQTISKAAAVVLTEYQPVIDSPLPDPDPFAGRPGGVTNPGRALHDVVAEFRVLGEQGLLTPEMVGRLTRAPEIISALYHLVPEEFVGLFGAEGFLEVLGPGVARVVPLTIDEEKLTPRGVAALRELERLRATLPPEGVEGAIGRFFPSE
jgi:hypothetical protein